VAFDGRQGDTATHKDYATCKVSDHSAPKKVSCTFEAAALGSSAPSHGTITHHIISGSVDAL